MKTKQDKHREALERQEEWDVHSVGCKLKLLSQRPGSSTKQVKKLRRELRDEQEGC